MKKILLSAFLAASAIGGIAQETKYVPAPENIAARQQFQDSKFGIFLHWGLYSMFAQGEWYMQNEGIDRNEYAKVADAFYPHAFDAHQWVSAFKAAGAKYICFTSRHHDGFSMWNTRCSNYNIMNTPYGKDILRQLADECHKQGIGFHVYYSHIDWTRDDYPMGRTGRNTGKDPNKANWKSYFKFMNNQLTEILTEYGKVDCIWFDGLWDHDQDSIPFNWELSKQYSLIHHLQPACLIGNNHHQEPFDGEDIQMFERDIPGENKSGLSGQGISRLPLESCETMNGMWGYKIKDQNYKSPSHLLRLLIRSAGKGANLLLNVGPQPNGEIPETALNRLQKMGEWLNKFGESIYGTVAGGIISGDSITSTQSRKDGALYLHLLTQQPLKKVTVPCSRKIHSVSSLTTGIEIPYKRNKKDGTVTFSIPDMKQGDVDYIIKVQ